MQKTLMNRNADESRCAMWGDCWVMQSMRVGGRGMHKEGGQGRA